MKRFVILALMASAGMASAPAFADQIVTGTVNLTGHVDAKCYVGSDNTATTFTATHDFGELAGSDGKLRTDLAADFNNSAYKATVICNTGTPYIAISATPMTFTGSGSPPTGYDDTINYSGHVNLTTVGSNGNPYNFSTSTPLTKTAVGSALSSGVANVAILADTFSTSGGGYLVANPNYSGAITITITPS